MSIASPSQHGQQDETKVIEICILCDDAEFNGYHVSKKDSSREELRDQVIWRKSDEPLLCRVLKDGVKPHWDVKSFQDLKRNSWDGTVYLTKKVGTEPIKEQIETVCHRLNDAKLARENDWLESRGVACSAFQREWVSISLRRDALGVPVEAPALNTGEIGKREWKPKKSGGIDSPYLFSFSNYCEVLYDCVLSDSADNGLIIIMGETGCGKTEIAYGLMHLFLVLERKRAGQGFRHVVTMEDPIEKQLNRASREAKRAASEQQPVPDIDIEKMRLVTGVEYTARHKTFDTTLEQGLKDCLRQKPVVVGVGEVREKDDWRDIIDFAGTGHLVVATAHAGSLTEAMRKIFDFLDAHTPAARGEIASKILGMVHLQPTDIEVKDETSSRNEKTQAMLITLWRRSHGGADKMMSEGIASIAPFSNDENRSSLGAVAIAEALTSKWEDDSTKCVWKQALLNKARERDLERI